MKTILKISFLFLLLFSSHNFFAQEDTKIDIGLPLSDSIIIKTNPIQYFNYRFSEFEFIRDLNSVDHLIELNENDDAAWLKTKLLISSLSSQKDFNQPHFTSTLYKQYLEDQEFSPVRYVLGMAQLGAVGYLAYKHIKKYGFLND